MGMLLAENKLSLKSVAGLKEAKKRAKALSQAPGAGDDKQDPPAVQKVKVHGWHPYLKTSAWWTPPQ